MDKKKKNIIIISIIGVVFVAALGLVGMKVFQGFSAKKYVDAVLDQNVNGEVGSIVGMTKGLTEDAAKKQYEQTVEGFLNNVVAAESLPLDEEQKKACMDACKDIFAELNYRVVDEKKVDDKEYEVTVQIKVSDVIAKLKTLLEAETERINTKVENGEYRGTMEEIDAQMKADYAVKLADVLKEAAKTMKDGESKTVVVTVKKGENGLYNIEGSQISEILTKMMGLSKKED
jgi:small nuclear ribonucleoprotein (snRNP)-like protein